MLKQFLDDTLATIERGQVQEAMTRLFYGLRLYRRKAKPYQWKKAVKEICLNHPLLTILHQDPLTKRAFDKPRGYAGDAVMLDMIYDQDLSAFEEVSEVGRQIFGYTSNAPAARAVRCRRALIADLVDDLAQQVPNPRVLALASGHLREAELSRAVRGGQVAEYVALDQDEQSLAWLAAATQASCIRTVLGSVISMLHWEDAVFRKQGLRDFDFVYAAGLFDYLPEGIARGVTAIMWKMLKPGGKVLIANYVPDITDVGYMESYMMWHLIYRTESDMLKLVSDIPRETVAQSESFTDAEGNIHYLSLSRC